MNTKTDCHNCRTIREKYDRIKTGFDILSEMHQDYHDWKEGKKDHSDYSKSLVTWADWMVKDGKIEDGRPIKDYRPLMRVLRPF